MAFINMSIQYDLFTTPVPNAFIDRYMSAQPVFALVYILGFRHCFHANNAMMTKDIAETLGILESDVVNAWRHWEREGLVKLHGDDENMNIEFLPVPEKSVQAETKAAPRPVILQNRPQYTTEELEYYKSNNQTVDSLFKTAESCLAKLLTYQDLSVIFGLHDWLRLPLDVIELLLTYCAENDHRNIRYIEKVAIDWADNEIDTTEKAREYISRFNTEYREILKAFGHSRRDPTPSEIKYMKKWLNEYRMPLEIILEACDKTILQTGQARFSYADKILTDWHEKGIKTIEAVKTAEESFFKEKAATKKGKSVAKPKKSRFINYQQRENDYDQLEKQERAYLQELLKG